MLGIYLSLHGERCDIQSWDVADVHQYLSIWSEILKLQVVFEFIFRFSSKPRNLFRSQVAVRWQLSFVRPALQTAGSINRYILFEFHPNMPKCFLG